MRVGLYAGSFDPITWGHVAVIEQALNVVDELHVIATENPGKKGMFDMIERQLLIQHTLTDKLRPEQRDRVQIGTLTGALTVDYAKLVDATILIRGLRNGADYAAERSLAAINKKLAPNIETIFIQTPVEYEEVSSSTVKGLMKFRGGDVAARDFVSPEVLEALRSKSYF